MNDWIFLLTGFAFATLLWLPASILAFRRVARRKAEHIQRIEDAHKSDWQTLIYLLNHTGKIPHESTGVGLTSLISRSLRKCIGLLRALLQVQDWHTEPVIEELEGVALVEMEMLNQKLEDILESHRNHLRDFDYKQNGSESSDQNP